MADVRAGIYARISPTPGEGAGWARQLADCRDLIAARGWVVAGEFVDRQVSAYSRRARPEWDRLMAALEAGELDALVVYHPDRAYRRGAALEALIDVVESRGIQVATVKAGDLDLSTATGRMGARIVAAVAQHESERMGERVSRAKRERASQGRPPGGGFRAFGYKADKVTIEPGEADLIREAAERVAAGGSIFAEARRWNDAGVTTTAGRPWKVASVRRVLTSARVAGLREYRGEIVGEASWPAIVDRGVWERLRAMTAARAGRPQVSGTWLLSGLIECPHCHRPMYGSSKAGARSYVCAPAAVPRCGKSSVSADAADRKVEEFVAAHLADLKPYAARAFTDRGVSKAAAELDAINDRKVALAQRWAAGKLTDDEYDAARQVLAARAAAIDAPPVPVPGVPDLEVAWRDGSIPAKRAVIEGLIRTPIVLAPGRAAGGPGDRLTIDPLWSR